MELDDGMKMISIDYKQYWREFLISILFLVLICVGIYEYESHKLPTIETIQSVSIPEISKALSEAHIQATAQGAKDIVQTIEHRVQIAPDKVFVTQTQAQADKQADKIAKSDKSDVVIKQQEKKADGQVVNEYFGIHMQKTNQIAVGVSIIDSKAYVTLAVQHQKVILEVHSKDFKSIQGATVMYSIKRY